MHNRGDVDIDFQNRDKALENLPHIAASIIKHDGKITKHNTGVYFHAVPTDPITGNCSLDYEEAKRRNMYKIDFLNVGIYSMIRDETHLLELMAMPMDWKLFEDKEFVSKLFHLNNYGELTAKLKPKSITDIAMILAMIRPGKKHLQEQCITNGFSSIESEIWKQDSKEFGFKKAHSISYSMVVYIHANLIITHEDTNKQQNIEQITG